MPLGQGLLFVPRPLGVELLRGAAGYAAMARVEGCLGCLVLSCLAVESRAEAGNSIWVRCADVIPCLIV